MSLPLLRAANSRRGEARISIGEILDQLGERSFGWCLLLFTIVNLLPLPIGATLITALPLMFLTGQMVAGRRQVALPRRLLATKISCQGFRRAVHRLRPVTRQIEKMLRPRMAWLFARRHERLLGLLMFVISATLFLPVPLSAWGPAIAMLICSLGLIERDGAVLIGGLIVGAASIAVTVAVVLAIMVEANALF